MHSISLQTTVAMLRILLDYTSTDFEALGITKAEAELLSGNVPWQLAHKQTVMRTLDAVLFGSLDLQGLPRMKIFVEYTAAAIFGCVGVVNCQKACVWLAERGLTGAPARLMASTPSGDVERCTPEQLSALVAELRAAEPSSQVHSDFRNKFGLALAKATTALGAQ